ncbi:MAG TPA: type II secretion system protein [Candidatus Chromulinivoraceae bacterium]|nr:type II secretion system protein [Candidatus Chromulinivoraceae bacterium]
MNRFYFSTTKSTQKRSSGFTLIELLLYVAIVGGLLLSVSYFFAMAADSRLKNQTISEINQQGAAVMDYITQTIRNSTSISIPTRAGMAANLKLVVPTGTLSPTLFDTTSNTILGVSTDGGTTDNADKNSMNATRFTASATGTITTLYALLGPTVAASPNNMGQMAIYSGTSAPTTLIASSPSTILTPSAWNAFIIAPTAVTSGQTYWLVYNNNGLLAADNNLRFSTTGTGIYLAQTFGTWPATWSGGTTSSDLNSMYAPINSISSVSSLRVTEGAGSPVSLTNSKVQINGLTFKNLSPAGTPGVVQISFTLTRFNPSSKNEYDYQKTFTGSAEVQW